MKATFERKIIAGFIACVLVLLAVAFISFRNSEKFVDTNQWVNHTHEVLYELEQILLSSVDAETGTRGFVITGQANFLGPFVNSKVRISDHIAKAKALTKDNLTQQTNLDGIEKLTVALISHLESCIELRKKDFEEAKERIATGEGKQIEDNIRNAIDNAKEVEQALLSNRKKLSEEDAQSFNVVFILLLVAIMLVLLIVYFIISSNLKALQRAEKETMDKNWSLSGSGELIKSMQGNGQLFDLAQTIINHLATYLNAQAGAIYLTEEGGLTLRLAGAHAVDQLSKNFPVVGYGEGVVGQAAAERRNILLEDIPSANFKINTTFGNIVPKTIMSVPFMFEDKVIGVIELGTISAFSRLQKEYLEIVIDSIAVAIVSSQARSKTASLLEETQQQAEELSVQQEELKQTNEELQEKTGLLEVSEAELKAQQEELQQSNEELEEKANLLEEQKERLEVSRREIESKATELGLISKYKSEFLSNMSHELRTPLNSILILSQLLVENKNNVLREKEIEFARNIHHSGSDLLTLINEILDLSKIEAGKMEMELSKVAVSEVVAGVQSMFTEVAKSRLIDFEIKVDKTIQNAVLSTDKLRLDQILRNLLSNAFKFTFKSGKVTLEVRRPSGEVSFRSNQLTHSEVIAFSVSDTGIGIAPEKQSVVFEAFQQADGSTRRKYGGTGLGLSISRELSTALGGEIQLTSLEGEGSTFTLYLPLQYDKSKVVDRGDRVEIQTGIPAMAKEPQAAKVPAQDHGDKTSLSEADIWMTAIKLAGMTRLS